MSVGTAKSQGTDEFSPGCVSSHASRCSCGHAASINTHIALGYSKICPILPPCTSKTYAVYYIRWLGSTRVVFF